MMQLGEIIEQLKVIYDNSDTMTEQEKGTILKDCIDALNQIELNPI